MTCTYYKIFNQKSGEYFGASDSRTECGVFNL